MRPATQASSAIRRLTLIVFFLFVSHLHAQYENGGLVGTIRDASGAPITGAAVKITNKDAGSVSESKTNGAGDYEFPSLRVGVYSVSANATGFSDAVANNITISVGNRQRIDLTLK